MQRRNILKFSDVPSGTNLFLKCSRHLTFVFRLNFFSKFFLFFDLCGMLVESRQLESSAIKRIAHTRMGGASATKQGAADTLLKVVDHESCKPLHE